MTVPTPIGPVSIGDTVTAWYRLPPTRVTGVVRGIASFEHYDYHVLTVETCDGWRDVNTMYLEEVTR